MSSFHFHPHVLLVLRCPKKSQEDTRRLAVVEMYPPTLGLQISVREVCQRFIPGVSTAPSAKGKPLTRSL